MAFVVVETNRQSKDENPASDSRAKPVDGSADMFARFTPADGEAYLLLWIAIFAESACRFPY
jgi:hypothetical protein